MCGTGTREMRRTVLYPVVDALAKPWLAEMYTWRRTHSSVAPGQSPEELPKSSAWRLSKAAMCAGILYFAASAAIFSITIADDPPRAYTFPLAVTLCPAKGISLSFWPAEGVVSAIGQ